MSRKTQNIISVAVVLAILIGLYAIKFIWDMEPRLGLDLDGGTSLIYLAKGKNIDPDVLDRTVENIRNRVDKLGVAEPEIAVVGNDTIEVQLPGIDDPERAKQVVGQTAQLQFRIVLQTDAQAEEPGEGTGEETGEETAGEPATEWKETVGDELNPENTIILPYRFKNETTMYKLGPTLLTGDAITEAKRTYDSKGNAQISFQLSDQGSKAFEKITGENTGKQLAIVLDYKVESAPNIQDKISRGEGVITGDFSDKEAKDLAIVLQTGALPIELELESDHYVSATLGSDSLRQGLVAGIVGIILVAFYILLFYRALGIVACMGLGLFGLYIYVLLSIMNGFWTMTLAGIAGVIVSIGVAGDSSIVYFERLKEELAAGRTLRSSVDSSFRSAFKTAITAKAVSLGGAAILYMFAVGSVRGFALTLGIGSFLDILIYYFFTRPAVALFAGMDLFQRPWMIGFRVKEEGIAGGDAR